MPRLLRHTLLSTRDLLISAGPLIVLGVLLLWGAYVLLDPAPPKKVVLATGPEQGDFAEFGKRYQAELKHFGIAVELRATAGAGENLKLLRDSAQHVDLAFVRGGAGDAILAVDEQNDSVPLVSLGSLFYEPVWIFYSEAAARHVLHSGTLNQLAQLRTLRINVGPRGSGGSNLFSKLLHANRIERETLQLSHLAPTPAVVALLAGDIDALVFVSAPESPLVQMLLQTPNVRLFDFAQAEAYARRFAFLSAQQLPRGIVDLAADLPPHDVHLLAPTAVLAARDGTHPALIQLFVQAAQKIHSGPGWFAQARQFPSPQAGDMPLAHEAERFYRNGPPLLQRYLPFWLANLIDRMWVVLVSIVAVLIPLSRVVPPLYTFRIRSRVFRWYAQLREIEDALGRPNAVPADLSRDLDALEARVERIAVPLSYADELYSLRSHIEMVRTRLRQAAPTDSSSMSRSAATLGPDAAATAQRASALTSAPASSTTSASDTTTPTSAASP